MGVGDLSLNPSRAKEVVIRQEKKASEKNSGGKKTMLIEEVCTKARCLLTTKNLDEQLCKVAKMEVGPERGSEPQEKKRTLQYLIQNLELMLKEQKEYFDML